MSFLAPPGLWMPPGPSPPDIRVNDVAVESGGESELTAEPSPETMRRQWRRSSWCPEEERKKEEKQEKQRSLAIVGKRYTSQTAAGQLLNLDD